MNKLLAAAMVVAVLSGGGLWYRHGESGRAMASQGGSASHAVRAAADAKAGPSLSIHIDPHWRNSRLAQCDARKAQYQATGLWVQGDAVPVVDRTKWQELSVGQKADVFDIAACIGNAGQVLEIVVSVLDRDSGKILETRRLISDRDFEQRQE